jgi:hypothetical protein
MSEKFTFKAVIEDAAGGGAFIKIPFDVEAAFGKKRVKVKATIDGEPYRGSLVRMGEPCHILGILKDIRKKVGKGVGEEIEVTLEEDLEPRVVEVPADLAQAFAQDSQAESLFQRLSYTHQKEYVTWIESAKQESTRCDRVAKTIEKLKQPK